jgi:hypothetical protein
MTAAELAKAIRRTSLAMPINHPDQAALQEAHDALMAAPTVARPNVLPMYRPAPHPADTSPPSAA